MHLTHTLCVLHALLISYHLCIQTKIYMHLTPTLCVLHVLLIFIIYSLSRTRYMHLIPTLCMQHAQLISYHICLLPNITHSFDIHTLRAAYPTNILSPMSSPTINMHLTTHCVLHAQLIFYILWILPNTVQAFDTTQYVLHALLIFYYLCLPPNTLHAFDTHTKPAACPTNILSSMFSSKKVTCIWHPLIACCMPY